MAASLHVTPSSLPSHQTLTPSSSLTYRGAPHHTPHTHTYYQQNTHKIFPSPHPTPSKENVDRARHRLAAQGDPVRLRPGHRGRGRRGPGRQGHRLHQRLLRGGLPVRGSMIVVNVYWMCCPIPDRSIHWSIDAQSIDSSTDLLTPLHHRHNHHAPPQQLPGAQGEVQLCGAAQSARDHHHGGGGARAAGVRPRGGLHRGGLPDVRRARLPVHPEQGPVRLRRGHVIYMRPRPRPRETREPRTCTPISFG